MTPENNKELRALQKTSEKLVCPSCLTEFTHEDMHEARKKVASRVLVKEGFSFREIGKMLDMHPETVKYWSTKGVRGTAPITDVKQGSNHG